VRQVPSGFVAAVVAAGVLAMGPQLAAAAGPDHSGDLARELELTNAARQAAGLEPLAYSRALSDAAQTYSQVLAADACFDHTCGGLPNFADRVASAGYTGWTALAENIAAGYPTPEAVVAGWMASPGHRANILSPSYHEIGVGVVSGGRYGSYWTQEFGARPGHASADVPAPPAADAGDDDANSGE
jgi:uncharacterized protein YkwD